MKPYSISIKLYITSALVLTFFSVTSFFVLYRAQFHQANRQMEVLLDSEILSLSALVNGQPNGHFDFEITDSFLTQFTKIKKNEFFRFMELDSGKVLFQTPGAPDLACDDASKLHHGRYVGEHDSFQIETSIFKPQADPDLKDPKPFEVTPICLVVGISRSPYQESIKGTLISTIPFLLGAVLFSILIFVYFIRRVTRDLSLLTQSLANADFGASHAFPSLPAPQTLEVMMVVERLEKLHSQANNFYEDIWLFLGRASHQLKTPIAAVLATLDVLLRKDRSKEELVAALKDLQLSALQLGNISRKLITQSRISIQESDQRELISLRDFFIQQFKIFASQAQAASVELQLGESALVSVSTNPFLLSEIAGNLIDNAIRYSKSSLRISWVVAGDKIEIYFADKGPGFSDSVRKTIFQAFARGEHSDQAEGSGLGLATAKMAAEAIGAELKLAGPEVPGATMILILPLA